MHFIFFEDYKQLSKPANYATYYGAATEENINPEDMKVWFANELQLQSKRRLTTLAHIHGKRPMDVHWHRMHINSPKKTNLY